jgi:hypothetical protein
MPITNLIANTDFAADLTGYWQEFGGISALRVTTGTYTGVAAMETTADTTADGGNPQRNRYDKLTFPTNGLTITAAAVMKGTGTWRLLISEMNNVGTVLDTSFSDPILLTSTYEEYSVTRVCDEPTGDTIRWGIQVTDDNVGTYVATVGYALLYEGPFQAFLPAGSSRIHTQFQLRPY